VPEQKFNRSKRYEDFKSPDVDLIEAPFGFGGTDNLAQEGPHAVLVEQEIERNLEAVGVKLNLIQAPSLGPFEIQEEPKKIRNLDAIMTVNNWLAETVQKSIAKKNIPVILGGDGSLSLGTVAGIIDELGVTNKNKLGIIWISNHLQNSSPRVTKSWNANRMMFTAMTFDGDAKHEDFIKLMNFHNLGTPILPKENIVHIGINHKSAQEKAEHLFFTMEDVDEHGIKKIANEAIRALDHCEKVHIIWDVNSMVLSGVSNFSFGQLTYREALTMARLFDLELRRKNKLSSIDVVEHCPSREAWDRRGETAEWITDIICNIFGENIFNAARKY
jgi:arginase